MNSRTNLQSFSSVSDESKSVVTSDDTTGTHDFTMIFWVHCDFSTFFKAYGLRTAPVAPPKANSFFFPTAGHGVPSGSGSIIDGIVLVRETPAAPPS